MQAVSQLSEELGISVDEQQVWRRFSSSSEESVRGIGRLYGYFPKLPQPLDNWHLSSLKLHFRNIHSKISANQELRAGKLGSMYHCLSLPGALTSPDL